MLKVPPPPSRGRAQRSDDPAVNELHSSGYDVIRFIARGTYGCVYCVRYDLDHQGAIKYVRMDKSRYRDEGIISPIELDIMARLQHPNVIWLEDILTGANSKLQGYGILMPLAEGTLDGFGSTPSCDWRVKLNWLHQVAQGLAFLHENGILHLDVKGSNVLIREGKAMIADFGLSIYVDDVRRGRTITTMRVSPDHRAPEILFPSSTYLYTEKVDIWSLGIMALYTLLGGRVYRCCFSPEELDDQESFASNLYHEMTGLFGYGLNRDMATQLAAYTPELPRLIEGMLRLQPAQRCDISLVLSNSLFRNHPCSIGTVIRPVQTTAEEALADLVLCLSSIYHLGYPDARVETLFLGVDLLYQCADLLSDVLLDNIVIQAACVWLSVKLVEERRLGLNRVLEALDKALGPKHGANASNILSQELAIIAHLNGCLYRPYLYASCQSLEQLSRTYHQLLLQPDSYLHVNTALWSDMQPDETQPQSKEVSVATFLNWGRLR